MTARTVTWGRYAFDTVEVEGLVHVGCDRVTLRELGTGIEHVGSACSDFYGFLNFLDTTTRANVTVVCINGQLFSSRTCFGPQQMMSTFVQDPAGRAPTFGRAVLPAADEHVLQYFKATFFGQDRNDLGQALFLSFPSARVTEDVFQVNGAGMRRINMIFGPVHFKIDFTNACFEASLAAAARERTRLANMALRAMDICDETDDDEAYFG